MFSDPQFRIALLISLFIHGAVLSPLPGGRFDHPLKDKLKRLEIVYYKIKENPPPEQKITQAAPQVAKAPAEAVKEPMKVAESAKAARDGDFPIVKKEDFLEGPKQVKPKVEVKEPEPEKPESSTLYAKATEPEDLPRDQRPLFLNYYQAIRERIKRSTTYPPGARRNLIEGSTLLSFVLANDGTLKEAVVRKSSGNTLLDQSALKSLEDASPFPPFPIRLRQPRLRLTVPISYELE